VGVTISTVRVFCVLGDGLMMQYDKIEKVMDSKQFGRIVGTPKINVSAMVPTWYEPTTVFLMSDLQRK